MLLPRVTSPEPQRMACSTMRMFRDRTMDWSSIGRTRPSPPSFGSMQRRYDEAQSIPVSCARLRESDQSRWTRPGSYWGSGTSACSSWTASTSPLITGRHRHVPARLETALFERDLSCVVPKCGVTMGLETHHWQIEVRDDGPTIIANLCRLCSIHHDMASNGGWSIDGGPGRMGVGGAGLAGIAPTFDRPADGSQRTEVAHRPTNRSRLGGGSVACHDLFDHTSRSCRDQLPMGLQDSNFEPSLNSRLSFPPVDHKPPRHGRPPVGDGKPEYKAPPTSIFHMPPLGEPCGEGSGESSRPISVHECKFTFLPRLSVGSAHVC